MKEHAIIPIFISHRGCPNDCVFCNQKRITSHSGDVTPKMAEETIEKWLSTLGNVKTVEISFYGGSFTALPLENQAEFLKVAKKYKDLGKVQAIHLSTRPDYIDEEILDHLKTFGVDVIELGVQSFSDQVLEASGRGHGKDVVYQACQLIQSYGFSLGIQLMIGLPKDSLESCIYSAKETVKLKPAIARLYPTVILKDTLLYEMYRRGEYQPLTEEKAVERTMAMYEILEVADINIIRVGLKSSELMDGEIGFHPAFRQLVEGKLARKRIEQQIMELYPDLQWFGGIDPQINDLSPCLVISANEKSYGNLFGHKGVNREYFLRRFPMIHFRFSKDYEENLTLKDNEYVVQEDFAPEI